MIETGYFGIPGSKWATKTHITEERRPICRVGVRHDAEFQMCANGAHLRIVECKRCEAEWSRRSTSTTAEGKR